jgi:hypothetical protein
MFGQRNQRESVYLVQKMSPKFAWIFKTLNLHKLNWLPMTSTKHRPIERSCFNLPSISVGRCANMRISRYLDFKIDNFSIQKYSCTIFFEQLLQTFCKKSYKSLKLEADIFRNEYLGLNEGIWIVESMKFNKNFYHSNVSVKIRAHTIFEHFFQIGTIMHTKKVMHNIFRTTFTHFL